eukprot:8519672-Pyramimonas_sp.AAC.1
MAARLAREDKVKGSVAKTITPTTKYANMHNASEDDVAAGHASWFRKFRAEVATVAKLIWATHEAGDDLRGKKLFR